jgi:hypothetical protein
MTALEWSLYNDPVQMLVLLDRPQGDLKLYLYLLACCRNIWPLLPQPEMREAVEYSYRYLDGEVSYEQHDKAVWRLEGELYSGVEYYANRPGLPVPEEIAGWVAIVDAIPVEQLMAIAGCGGEVLPENRLLLLRDAGYFAFHAICSMPGCSLVLLNAYKRFMSPSLLRMHFVAPEY